MQHARVCAAVLACVASSGGGLQAASAFPSAVHLLPTASRPCATQLARLLVADPKHRPIHSVLLSTLPPCATRLARLPWLTLNTDPLYAPVSSCLTGDSPGNTTQAPGPEQPPTPTELKLPLCKVPALSHQGLLTAEPDWGSQGAL